MAAVRRYERPKYNKEAVKIFESYSGFSFNNMLITSTYNQLTLQLLIIKVTIQTYHTVNKNIHVGLNMFI